MGNYGISSGGARITTTGNIIHNQYIGYSRTAFIYSEGGDNIDCYVTSSSTRYPVLSIYRIQGVQDVSSISIKSIIETGTNTAQSSEISAGNLIFGFCGGGANPSNYNLSLSDGERNIYTDTGILGICGYIHSGSASISITTVGGGLNGIVGTCIVS